MKRIIMLLVLPSLLLCPASVFASAPPNPADYTVNIHVTSSRIQCGGAAVAPCGSVLFLDAVIDGQKYELRGNIQNPKQPAFSTSLQRQNFDIGEGYLALGDYRAKLLPANPKDPKVPYFIITFYELLLPDGRVAEFQVVGQSE